ncbi:PAS domain S-box-containing protein/diguanylate cyclase (GGDEF) domain-containing protein/HDIG domain-containing protein [Acetoanaerobium noterae]|uniref:PAS domain S-box-containing protein/diguanylate cyclase (GGDEF) domain-containing protein/HDIG domain-containing protein n=1 Tax=Acetoanaerobium noterae TaxID=745369 RepID=A0A1T5AP23_9FIRM|nr:HD domain-containing phosphohydrolase [Acetoanaerobium noterae]SKB36774.1 PAS domain S-box-containing protein/diguanylate cyclase (GGDEF) domain-containing protein/HDIG domain-containing protein [Acetoanaerobium noterae]
MYTIIAALIAIGLIFSLFKTFDTRLLEEIEKNLTIENEYYKTSISSQLEKKSEIINNLSTYMESKRQLDYDELLDYMKAMLNKNSNIESIYFGSTDNLLVNGSGWIPPEDFDLRTRPWYVKAINHGKLVITDVFLNATSEKHIITIAKPVYSNKGQVIGVLGADLSLDSIVDMISVQDDSYGEFFILNEELELIAKSRTQDGGKSILEDTSLKISSNISSIGTSVAEATLNNEKGYVSISKIDGTNLYVGVFNPIKSYNYYDTQWRNILIISVIFLVGLLLIMFLIQNKIIIKPAYTLENDIKQISVTDNINYRLEELKRDPFENIRKAVNARLAQTEVYFSDLLESKLLLEKSQKRNAAIINVLPDIIFMYDSKGVFIDCQTNDEAGLVLSKDLFIGKNISEVMPPDISEKAIMSITKTIATGQLQKFEYNINIDGSERTYEARMVKSNDNEVLAISRDITSEKQEQEYILKLTYKDQLTGLYNRRYYEEQIEKLSGSEFLPLAIIMVDVNGLKLTNDAFGHHIGDELLKKVAKNLISCDSKGGFACRVGGDEFLMVFPNTDEKEAEYIVDKLYGLVSAERLENIVISISAGWQVRTDENQSIRDTLIKAENHMFRKKIVESQSMRNQTVNIIMQTLSEKNEREKRHSVEVAKWAKEIGVSMGLSVQKVKEIELAGLLHDIGKIAIKEDILNKPGKLTEEEYDEIKRHPESGYHILKSVDEYSSLAQCVLEHHERFDGKGYPKGIKGSQISLIARIIAVADAFEAMIAQRPYRKSLTEEMAIEEIKKNSNTQFDPEVVTAFLKIFDKS